MIDPLNLQCDKGHCVVETSNESHIAFLEKVWIQIFLEFRRFVTKAIEVLPLEINVAF